MSLRNRFVELFESGCAVEVDGVFCRHFAESVSSDLSGPDDEAIYFDLLEVGGGEVHITNEELDTVKLTDNGTVWEVADYKFIFYSVEPIQTQSKK